MRLPGAVFPLHCVKVSEVFLRVIDRGQVCHFTHTIPVSILIGNKTLFFVLTLIFKLQRKSLVHFLLALIGMMSRN